MNKRLNPITEDDFKKHIHPHLIELKDGRSRPALISDYDFFCAVLFVMRTGVAWRDLPSHYGSWHTGFLCLALGRNLRLHKGFP